MAENDNSQEKTEEPTQRKLDKAKEDGQIPRSRDLTTTFVLLGGVIGMMIFGPQILERMSLLSESSFSLPREHVFDTAAMLSHLSHALVEIILVLFPLFAILLVASIVGPVALGGWLLSGKAMMPKGSRLDPLAGLKRMFSLKALMELFKALGKVLVILSASILMLMIYRQQMLRLADTDVVTGVIDSFEITGYVALGIAASTILIAMIDVPFQIWDNKKKLRMSRQEVKDEMKDTDGKPEVKSKVRQLQREMAQRRMMSSVPEADVVITNPTHYAVALKYDPDTMDTPVLLAKGSDNLAMKIREIAQAHRVDRIESPVLARAIYHTTEIDHPVPSGLYMAVAQVLAYVFQLRNFRRGRGDKPPYPRNPPVPREYRY